MGNRNMRRSVNNFRILHFDISSEYPFLLMHLLVYSTIPSKVVLESRIKSSDEFYVSVVKPKDFEDDVRVKQGLSITIYHLL